MDEFITLARTSGSTPNASPRFIASQIPTICAANASPKGAEILLDCKTVDQNVVFEVKDFGAGIDKDEIDKIFARFESKGKNGHRGGAGLGLSIVKSFVGLHHGDVQIDSVLEEGTTVTCTLPIDFENPTEASRRDIG